jgi:hypothetical protein
MGICWKSTLSAMLHVLSIPYDAQQVLAQLAWHELTNSFQEVLPAQVVKSTTKVRLAEGRLDWHHS